METDVAVIGAGAAGLAAALSLARGSHRVVVLEARDRVGGRAWSVSSPVVAELGAEFIHGPAPATTSLLRAAQIATVPVGGDAWTCGNNGAVRRSDEFFEAAGIFDGVLKLPHDESVEQYLQRFQGKAEMRETIADARLFVEGFDAADPAIASARAIAEEWRSGTDFASARPIGGYGPMFAYLRDECIAAGVWIQLSATVRRIAWRRGAVAIDLKSDRQPQTVRAKAAIVTVPVSVLRHGGDGTILFEPKLPESKLKALAKLETGPVVHAGLVFKSAFWESIQGGRYRDSAFFRCPGQPFATYWTQVPQRRRLLVAWVGGPKAAALLTSSRADIIEGALRGLEVIFGKDAPVREQFESALMHDWSRDPFARGAYSYVAVGGGNARADFAAPVEDALFFAGEATATNGEGGTVNGALETGERAAREAAAAAGASS